MAIIISLNLLALIPSLISALGTLLSVGSVICWLGYNLNIFLNVDEFFSSMVPNAPLLLGPLLLMVEVLSFFIRPVAMTLRIIINLMCSHLLLMMSGILINWSNIVVAIALIVLELGVCVVQSYVIIIILGL